MYHELDWPTFLDRIAVHTRCQRAKQLCLKIGTCTSASEAVKLSQDTLAAKAILETGQVPEFSYLDTLPPVLDRLQLQAVLDVKELVVLRQFLNNAIFLKKLLKEVKNAWTTEQSYKLVDFKSQLSAIEHVLSPEGEINEHASPALQELCDERRKLQREISRTLDQIVVSRRMENLLQDRFVTNREGRMVIPVKSGSQHDVKGLIHDASQTKQTVFMEPEEVIPLNNRLREVQIEIQEEIYRILKQLSDYLARFQRDFATADAVLVETDLTLAKAQIATELKATDVHFSSSKRLHLINLRHPLLVLQGVEVIPNTVTIDSEHRILLLSGPNAGGKTILLKAVGLVSQMARCGLPAPVEEGSQIPFFTIIDPIVGDLQSVGENLSSFSSHIKRLNQALSYSGEDTLVVVDEICGATDPEEGAALARSFIENFIEHRIFAVITSHLGPLKEHWSADRPVISGSLEFDIRTSKPTYQLLVGFPGQSLAIALAARLGVPKNVIDRANQFLSPESQARSRNLQEIDELKSKIIELKTQAQKERDEAKKAKDQYTELVKKFREQRDKWLEKALQKADKKVEQLIEDARQQRLKDRSLHDIKADLPEIIKARPSSSRIQTLEDFKFRMKPGTPAFLSRLGRQVLVQSEPDSKGQVTVLADSMRLQVPWHHLGQVGAEEGQTKKRPAATPIVPSGFSSKNDRAEAELDLRGRRSDEAIELLEKFLDNCVLEQRDLVKIVHGFGTEQLKKSIRQYLSKSQYVEKWNGGDATTGGDGVTWVRLAD